MGVDHVEQAPGDRKATQVLLRRIAFPRGQEVGLGDQQSELLL